MLHSEFAMTDLVSLNYFLGISAQRTASGMFLLQSKFAEEILEWAHMQNCNSYRTYVDTESKLGPDGDPVADSTISQSRRCSLRILRYVRGTVNYGLQLHVSSTAQLTAYTDVDWVVCCNTSIIHIAVEAKYELLPQAGALPNTRSSSNEMRLLAMYVPEHGRGSSVPIDLFMAFALTSQSN
ncbi:ribonuclease H-like domain-containing protein [Tanacetum coccineum]|uniref:Ribonuclease H-like domain-containing protein n=1 Tax=Tanacetum coccineum TaxID=301880 RepID=A0ABQ5CJS4_9ASTR